VADSTAPILLAGGATLLADYMHGHGMEWRVALATGIACGVFALGEHLDHDIAVGAAWLALFASLVTPRKNGDPSPVQVFADQWNKTAPH
jgi:hypothetical protein